MAILKQIRSIRITVAALAAVVLPASYAQAITAKDVLERMSKDDRYNYLTGLIDMRAFQAAQSGDAAFSKCVNDAYYRDKRGRRMDRCF